jgi:hypothetical protein
MPIGASALDANAVPDGLPVSLGRLEKRPAGMNARPTRRQGAGKM